jgi:hypothetical protein
VADQRGQREALRRRNAPFLVEDLQVEEVDLVEDLIEGPTKIDGEPDDDPAPVYWFAVSFSPGAGAFSTSL